MAEEIQSDLKLGGDELDRAMRQAAYGSSSDRVELFKRLVAADLLVPVEKMPGLIDPGTSFPVPLVTNAKGSVGFPLFTNPQRLKEYAQLAGWTSGEEDPAYLGMNTQGAMEVATSTEAAVAVVDPGGPVPLIITRDEAETLIQGKIPGFVEAPPPPAPPPAPPPPPEPRAVTPPPQPSPLGKGSTVPDLPPPDQTASIPAVPAPVEERPAGLKLVAPKPKYSPPSVPIPTRIPSVLKVLMEQYLQVRLAVFFEQTSDRKVLLGLAMRSDDAKADPILKAAKDAMVRITKSQIAIDVVVLTPEQEPDVLFSCKPFYSR